MGKDRKYWGFRIYKEKKDFFRNELLTNNILRQGWGYKKEQNLLCFTSTDKSDKRNLPMLNVRQGDLIFIPNMFKQYFVTVSKALEDWKTGYCFSISSETGDTGDYDFGHMFPTQYICDIELSKFSDTLQKRVSLPPRFWEIKNCEQEIESLFLLLPNKNTHILH